MGIAKNFKCIGGYVIIIAPVIIIVNTHFSQNNQKPLKLFVSIAQLKSYWPVQSHLPQKNQLYWFLPYRLPAIQEHQNRLL